VLRDRGASEAEWRLCALEIEDEVPLSPREPQSAVSGLAIPRVGRGHFSYSACVTHEVLQSVCRHGLIDPVVMTTMRHSPDAALSGTTVRQQRGVAQADLPRLLRVEGVCGGASTALRDEGSSRKMHRRVVDTRA